MSQDDNKRLNFRIPDELCLNLTKLSKSQLLGKQHQGQSLQSYTLDSSSHEYLCERLAHHIDFEIHSNIANLHTQLHHILQQEKKRSTQIIDISVSGIGVQTLERLEQGDHVALTLILQDSPLLLLDLLAEVRWSTSLASGKHAVGLQFVFRQLQEEEYIGQYVFKKHRAHLRKKKHLS